MIFLTLKFSKDLSKFTTVQQCFIAPYKGATSDPTCGKSASEELILYGAVENEVGKTVQILQNWGAGLGLNENIEGLSAAKWKLTGVKAGNFYICANNQQPEAGFKIVYDFP